MTHAPFVTHHALPMTHAFLRVSTVTYKLEHVPVKDVVVGEALTVEKVPEELPQVRVVWFIVKAQRAAEVQVGGKLGFRGRKTEVRSVADQERRLKRRSSLDLHG
uniref:Uncharacterized protein n=1 Tax=Oryzias latipes TaxID=8090 RepID=A0A3P9J6W0_ORYLA